MAGFFQPSLESVFAPSGRGSAPFAARSAACEWRALEVFFVEPLVTVVGLVAGSVSVFLEEVGVVHGTQLADENGFGLLVKFGVEGHGSETRSMKLSRINGIIAHGLTKF